MRILTLNAFWFQGVPYAGSDPGDPRPEIVEGIRRKLVGTTADVLCLQEIQSPRAFEGLSEVFGSAGWVHGLYEPGYELRPYGVAVLSRLPLEKLGGSCDCAPGEIQRAYLCFRAGGRTLVNSHLPSGRQLGPEASARKRASEVATIADRHGVPDVWCGDFNERSGGDVEAWFERSGFVDAGSSMPEDHPYWEFRKIDFIRVRRELLPSSRGFSFLPRDEFLGPEGQPLSDHYPIWVDIG